ncbi:hypothetical protein DAI22_12g060700 [Oryza sativa Japonica Group]|nr:hypothetical protein DAI22_12g060700 [Oryza sativa Japonica Group]
MMECRVELLGACICIKCMVAIVGDPQIVVTNFLVCKLKGRRLMVCACAIFGPFVLSCQQNQ